MKWVIFRVREDTLTINDDDLLSKELTCPLISFTTRCNLRCIYCASIQPGYVARDFDLKNLDYLLEGLKSYGVKLVQINGHGETTIIPDWPKLCRRILDYDIGVSITSNFSKKFDEEEIDSLARMEWIIISIDTVNRELLMKIRGVPLEVILDNMSRISSRAKELGVTTHFMWDNTLSDWVIPHLEEYVDCGLATGVIKFIFGRLIIHESARNTIPLRPPSELPAEGIINFLQIFDKILKKITDNGGEYYIQPGIEEAINESLAAYGMPPCRLGEPYNPKMTLNERIFQTAVKVKENIISKSSTILNKTPEHRTRNCIHPWVEPFIQTDGEVWPCCYINESLGNIRDRKFHDIWDGDAIRQLRYEILSGNMRERCRQCQCRSWTSPQEQLKRVRELPSNEYHLAK